MVTLVRMWSQGARCSDRFDLLSVTIVPRADYYLFALTSILKLFSLRSFCSAQANLFVDLRFEVSHIYSLLDNHLPCIGETLAVKLGGRLALGVWFVEYSECLVGLVIFI